MKILSVSQIREADAYTIAHEPIASIDLMERASTAFFACFTEIYSSSRHVTVFCGPGNNGGDGLAIARMLWDEKYTINVIVLDLGAAFSKDFLINHDRFSALAGDQIITLTEIGHMPDILPDTIIIDAIFGTGLSRPTTGLAASVIEAINDSNAEIIAVDMPSGLYTDMPNKENESIIKAHRTFTFQLPKMSFFFCSNGDYTGEWEALDIGIDPE